METSLDHLLSTCTDFVDEESLLQMKVRKLGAVCIHSPKYHCEMAGEGIEYSWGNAKMKYRRIKASSKRSNAQFLSQVRQCLSTEYLDKTRVRKNSRRARDYMCAYFLLSVSDGKDCTESIEVDVGELKPCAISAQKIEQMKQKVRCHRAAIDFDTSFCRVSVKIEP